MRLVEHPDFADLVAAAAEATGTPVTFVEKDYHVTAILRLYRERLGDGVIFKGGTSLSKGWQLVDRFSEDVDLFLAKDRCSPPLTSRGQVDRTLKQLRNDVATLDLTLVEGESSSTRGIARRDWFEYTPQLTTLAQLRPAVLVEIGTRSGDFPLATIELNSIVGAWISTKGDLAERINAADIAPFDMTLLHYRRTFVEKLFAIHAIACGVQDGARLGRAARHYADLHALAGTSDVTDMLDADEYRTIFDDCAEISAREFPSPHAMPADRSFATSPALIPDDDLRATLKADYEAECALLFYGPYPTFDQVLERLAQLAPKL